MFAQESVMDLQKEREAFKQHLTDTGLVEFAGYGFAVDECDEYLHEPTQVAWDSWLIGLNRAKAQAVPEGFVLIKDDTKTVVAIERMVEQQVEASGMDSRRLERLDGWKIIEAAVKAQEPAND